MCRRYPSGHRCQYADCTWDEVAQSKAPPPPPREKHLAELLRRVDDAAEKISEVKEGEPVLIEGPPTKE